MMKKFTVEKDNTDYKLGEYMLMKARAKKETALEAANERSASNLPMLKSGKDVGSALAAVFSYVNDKLTVKEAPIRDKTIRSFPFRTSITAFCSAMVVCALIVCCSIFGIKSAVGGNDNIIKAEETHEASPSNETETETEYTVPYQE